MCQSGIPSSIAHVATTGHAQGGGTAPCLAGPATLTRTWPGVTLSTMLDLSNPCGCGGGRIGFARLERDDRAAMLEVFEGLSERSRRLRFHGAKPRLSARELDHLVESVAVAARPSRP